MSMSTNHRPKTRLQSRGEQLLLLHLPEACLASIVAHAAAGLPWKERCRLAEVCRTFRTLFTAQAFSGRTLRLNLNTLSWRIMQRKRRAAARKELVGALARLAPSVSHLCLRYQLEETCTGLSLGALLAPLSPYVRRLVLEDGVCPSLLQSLCTLSSGSWPALEDVWLGGCNLWTDLEAHDLARLERQLAELPRLTERITKFECSCQGMAEGGESFFQHLTALRSLEMEDWAAWDLPRDYAPLRAMPHLTRLVLHIVEDLEANMANLMSLTQVRELSLLGCYRASSSMAQLTNLVMLDLQPLQALGPEGEEAMAAAAAAWKVGSLTELRWCGDLAFQAGAAPVDLPRLVALEIDEAYFPPTGLHHHLCSLTLLTSLRLVGGRCPKLPPSISQLAALQVLSIDSCHLPSMPPSISALTSVTNLQLSNTGMHTHVPPWVLQLPLQKLWLAGNQLSALLPPTVARMSAAAYEARQREWLGRLTHVCLSSNSLREIPAPLLQHATRLVELDLAYNQSLQIPAKTADQAALLGRLKLLRLEKSYWLRLEDRWTPTSICSIARLQQQRADLRVAYLHEAGGGLHMPMAW